MASRLFEKTQIGSMRLKNRIVMGPMGTTGEADGAYTMDGVYYFEERAKGGCGLIITGANVVSTKYEPRPCTELSNFHHVERLNMLVDRCHHWGAKVCVQLSPGLGRQQFTDPFTPPYSAGACSSFWFPNLICKPFAKEDIAYLRSRGIFDEGFLEYLRDFKFTGDVWAVPPPRRWRWASSRGSPTRS